MSRHIRDEILATMQAHAEAGHGDVYRWLKANRRHVKAGFKSTGAGWDAVVASLVKAGVTGRDGKVPNQRSVRRVWERLCANIKVEKAERATSVERKPSTVRMRADANWQPPLADARRTAPALQYRRDEPEEVLPPRRTDLSPPSQAPPASSKPKTIADLSPEGRAKIERLKRTLQEDDRKKFGHF